MFKCNNCGRLFSEEATVTIETGVRSEHYIESYDIAVCPHCGSNDYDEAFECAICGTYENQMQSEDYCEDCYKDMESLLTIAFENFKKQHDVPRKLIYDLAYEIMQDWEYEY